MANKAYTRYYVKGNTGNALHDGGTAVVLGGNVTGTNVTKSLTVSFLGSPKTGGSRVPNPASTSVDWTLKGISGGTFAGWHPALFYGYSTSIAGISNSILSRPGQSASTRRGINYKTTVSSVLQRAAGWNYVTGAFLTTPTAQVDTYKNGAGGSTIDTRAHASKATPGNIFFIVGKAPSTKAIPARNG